MQFFCVECGAKYALPDERAAGKIRLIIHTARPGIVIGPKGSEIEKLWKNHLTRKRREQGPAA